MTAEQYQAWLDLAGLVLPLIGAALITLVGIPDLVWSPLTSLVDGARLLSPIDHAPLGMVDTASALARASYFRWADTGMALATLGTGIQARKALKIISAR